MLRILEDEQSNGTKMVAYKQTAKAFKILGGQLHYVGHMKIVSKIIQESEYYLLINTLNYYRKCSYLHIYSP